MSRNQLVRLLLILRKGEAKDGPPECPLSSLAIAAFLDLTKEEALHLFDFAIRLAY